MIASRTAVKRPSMGFNMPKKHVLAIGAVVVVAVAAAILIPGRGKTPTTPNAEQAQLPLGQAAPNPIRCIHKYFPYEVGEGPWPGDLPKPRNSPLTEQLPKGVQP